MQQAYMGQSCVPLLTWFIAINPQADTREWLAEDAVYFRIVL